MSQRAQDVVAVVVTHNRRDLLAECLDAVLGQSSPPGRVVVVDNASSDGTADLLSERYPGVDVVHSRRNTGGAGGFALGIEDALRGHGDWIWLMDDDTVPDNTALGVLLAAATAYPGRPPVLLASRVTWIDGRDHPMNTPRPWPWASRAQRTRAARCGCVPIRSASFVSVLIDVESVRVSGPPIADFFLWNDDFEFTTRLIRGRTGLYCPASIAVHKTAAFGGTEVDPGSRFYYEVRNKVWTFTRSAGLGWAERTVYAGSTMRRWARTLLGSERRRELLASLVRGIVDGMRTGPRTNDEVLAGAVSEDPAR